MCEITQVDCQFCGHYYWETDEFCKDPDGPECVRNVTYVRGTCRPHKRAYKRQEEEAEANGENNSALDTTDADAADEKSKETSS